MKHVLIVGLAALLCACSEPSFVIDAPPVPAVTQTPDYFELPARFALARSVYGAYQPSSTDETALWSDLADKYDHIGEFFPLVLSGNRTLNLPENALLDAARAQRFNYLILVRMNPATGTADILLFHVGSGGLMATARAADPSGGRKGFWGGRINNPKRLEQSTLRISHASVPTVETMLRGVESRQR